MTPEGGQFELEALIEEGSYGTVFEYFDKSDGMRKVAMKKINLSKLSKNDRSSAETEARLLTTLQHQYILHAVSTFQEKETLCIETEFCDHGDLEQYLKSRKGKSLEEQRIVEWFRQICSALEYLHGRNVLHRDIRTRNIFLTGKEMTAKLGNFGLAKVLESFNNQDLSVRDNPYYMNPDAFAYIHYNSKTDIWALGVCVYEMVALKLPSDVPDIQQLGLNIFHAKLPPLPNGYSRALIEMLKWMMCRETERRPSALELLQNVLFKNHSASKAFFLPDENTTREKLSTCQDMDKTISNNPEYENNLPSKSTVLNSESFDATTPDTELSNVSGSETSSENFERTMAADRARSTLRPPPSTFTRFRSVLRSVKDWMIGDAGSYEINCATENTDMRSLQDEGKENFSAESREGLKNQIRFWNKNLPNEKHLYKYFWKEHSVFSQWYSCTFTVDEQTYSSAEQYMMHQKAVLMDDEESAKLILALNEPEEIKRIGRHIKNFNQELWEIYCLDVVEKGNMAKFSQNEKLRDELFSTYPKTLVEASPIDRIWGIGLSEKDKRAWNKETWRGQNLLGQILTKVRDKLMEPFLKPVDTEKGLV
uniref:non-specific serine/threonine protein kinase n=1 Tax=Magallana gigas TaxID=29159 RepID=A0A8W8J528_MAGGI|nr:serine/threonine-protein kinase Nek6-like isoform X1 [Crassostrea gigas]